MSIWTKAKNALLDQFGRPVQPQKTPSRRPLSSVALRESDREYVANGLTPQRLAEVFREADGGDMGQQAELFDQIEERDGHLIGERSKRVNVITDVEMKTEPADDSAKAEEIADFVDQWITSQTDWDENKVALQDAVGKGYAGMELHWDVSSGQALPSKLEFQEQSNFLFRDHKGILIRHPLWISDENPMGEAIPPWKMILHVYGGKSGHPTRSALHRVTAWWWMFKNYAVKDWITFAEVYGMPLRVGKYPAGANQEDKDALINALSSLGTDAAGIISDDTMIEFIKASEGKSSAEVFRDLASFGNKEISIAWVGQTLTADVGSVGSKAAAQVHNEVRMDLIKADARALTSTVRSQLIRPIVGFNFGWDAPCPKYTAYFPGEGDETRLARAEWVSMLLDRGVRMPGAWVRQQFNIPEPKEGEETIGQAIGAQDGGQPE